MNTRSIRVAVGFGLSWLALSGFAQLGSVKEVQLKPKTKMAKLSRVKNLLKLEKTPTGIVSSLTLTLNQPHIKHKGSLTLTGFYAVRFQEPQGEASGPSPGSAVPMDVHLMLNVAKPGKAHLITYSIYSGGAQDVRVNIPRFPSATFGVSAGAQTVSYAFVPTRAGVEHITFRMQKPGTFYRLEVDVVE